MSGPEMLNFLTATDIQVLTKHVDFFLSIYHFIKLYYSMDFNLNAV